MTALTSRTLKGLRQHGMGLACAAGLLAVTGFMYFRAPLTVVAVRQTAPTQNDNVFLPVEFLRTSGTAEYDLELRVMPWTPRVLNLRVDDCLTSATVNGVSAFSHTCKGCDHCGGMALDLTQHLVNGTNIVHVVVRNNVGPGSVDVRQARGVTVGHLFAWWLFGAAWWWFARRRQLPLGAWLVGVGGVVLGSVYRIATSPTSRQHDYGAHKEYIEHILNNLALPAVKQGWETWQPPFYYLVAAAWTAIGPTDRWAWAQLLSGTFYVCAVLLAAINWNRLTNGTGLHWLGAALFAAIPVHVFASARLSNDALMPLWGTITIILATSYLQHGQRRSVILLGLLLPLMIATKSNGLAFAAASGLTILVADQIADRPWRQRLVTVLWVSVPAALWWLGWMFRNHAQTGDWVYVMHNLPDGLHVDNSAYKYLGFDLKVFFTESVYDTFKGQLRESWPMSLGASALTGEYGFAGLNTYVGFMRAAFLPVMATFAVGVLTPPPNVWKQAWLPAILLFAFNLLFIGAYNWNYPYACHQDARMFGPCLLAVAVLYTHGLGVLEQRTGGLLRWLLRLSPVVFLALLLGFHWALAVPRPQG